MSNRDEFGVDAAYELELNQTITKLTRNNVELRGLIHELLLIYDKVGVEYFYGYLKDGWIERARKVVEDGY